MTIDEKSAKERTAVRALIDGLASAIRTKDVRGVMSVFSPEVVSFDLGAPLQHGGGGAFAERWQELFASYTSQIDYEIYGLRITVSTDVAFSHSLNRMGGTRGDGRYSQRWLRWTACYQKANGKWLIAHEHVSVPVDLTNGKAMLDLEP